MKTFPIPNSISSESKLNRPYVSGLKKPEVNVRRAMRQRMLQKQERRGKGRKGEGRREVERRERPPSESNERKGDIKVCTHARARPRVAGGRGAAPHEICRIKFRLKQKRI